MTTYRGKFHQLPGLNIEGAAQAAYEFDRRNVPEDHRVPWSALTDDVRESYFSLVAVVLRHYDPRRFGAAIDAFKSVMSTMRPYMASLTLPEDGQDPAPHTW
jgi:hypothetical protein